VAYTQEQFNQFVEEELTSPTPDFPWAPTVGIGLPVGAFAAGFIRTNSGKKVWDYYFEALRHAEGSFPLGMIETFRLSETISPFAAPNQIDLIADRHPELFRSRGFRDYLSHVTGKRISELEDLGAFNRGLYWQRTGSVLGDLRVRGGPVIASNVAAVSTGAKRKGFLVEWLSHVMGVKNPTFFKEIEETADSLRPNWLFAGGGEKGSKARLLGRYGYSLVSSLVGRMNLLLNSPFDLEMVEDWKQKAPILKSLNLGVKPGPAHSMLARYTAKAALAMGAYKALDYVDYLGREYGAAATVPAGALAVGGIGLGLGLKAGRPGRYAAIGAITGGVLGVGGEGPISALAGLYAQTRITQAEVAQATGIGGGARRTEDYFPGLTKPTTLVGSAALGLLLGGAKDWGERINLVRKATGSDWARPTREGAMGTYELVDKAIEEKRKRLYELHRADVARKTGFSRFASELKSSYYGKMKKGKFIAAGAGRTAAVGVAAYEALNIAGSVVSGDFVGAAFQTAAVGAATYAYAKKGGALGFGILALASLLREKEDPEKLKRIYSGEEKVPIRAGRFWEAGSTDYQGKRPYYRPHRVALIRSGADKAAMFGSESAFWSTDPLLNPIDFLMNPYAREELMWEQGYKFPVSKTPFEDTPILGPVLAATIGKILKPPKYLGTDQWLPEPTEPTPQGYLQAPSPDPILRTSLKGTVGEQFYRLGDMIGLPGFAMQSIKASLTGTETFFEEDQWATPSLVTGAEPAWWSLEMGGMGLLCIPAGSIIQTHRGLVLIENVLPGDSVLSRDSEFHLVEATSSRLADEITQVELSCLDLPLEATPNHVLPVYRVNHSDKNKFPDLKDRPIGDVLPGDYLEVPLPKNIVKSSFVKLLNKEKVEITPDIAFLLGCYAATGGSNNIVTTFIFDINEVEYAQQVSNLIKDEFDDDSAIYDYPDENIIILELFSSKFSELAQVLIGSHINEKQIHPKLYYASKEIRTELLAGYLLSRKFINKEGLINNENFSTQMFLTGISLEFKGKIHLDYLGGNKKNQINLSEKTPELLKEFLYEEFNNSMINESDKGFFIQNNKLYAEVKNVITTKRKEIVYDLLIEDLHYFTSNYLSIHNSEGIRRYIPHRRRSIEYKNPLPSDLPSWLPDAESGYFLDFSRADIYHKIKEPWYRLPGPGMAAMHPELKGVDPENYSTFWRYKILSDVSPWSREYEMYDRIVAKMEADNRLSAEQVLEAHTIRKQVADVKKAKRFEQYRYDSEAVERKRIRVTEELEPGVYLTDTFGSAPITLAGIDSSAASLGSVARTQDASITAREAVGKGLAKRAEVSDFLRNYIYPGAEIDVFVHKDPSNLMERSAAGRPQVPVVASVGGLNINRALVERGLAESMAEGEALDPMMATGGVQRAFGRFWENLAHGAETPMESFTPLAPVAKFIHQRTALEEYQRSEVYGREVALWQKPITHFLAPGLTTSAWWAGWRGLPREVQERYMVEEYFDRLEHEKWKRLQSAAAAEGEGRLAAKYARHSRKTKTGVNIFSEHSARKALSSKERAYFKEFVESPTARERRDISQIVSPQMRQILHAQWARRASEGARMRLEAGIGIGGDLASITRYDAMRGPSAQMARDQATREALAAMPVPSPAFVGWDPHADIEDYKVKTVLDNELEGPDYGIWSSDVKRVSRRPWVQSLDVQMPERERVSPALMRRRIMGVTNIRGHAGPRVYPRPSSHGSIEIDYGGHDRVNRYLRDPSIMQF
jgi:hypothetical protein